VFDDRCGGVVWDGGGSCGGDEESSEGKTTAFNQRFFEKDMVFTDPLHPALGF
jgi:hypothetical protein